MVIIDAEYLGEFRCHAKHGPSGVTLETDAPTDNHGRGQRFSPTDLVATALCTCIATTMAIKGEPKGWNLKGMKMSVEKEMSSDAPRRIVRLAVTLWMPPSFPVLDRAEAESIANNCPVHKSIHPDIKAPVTIRW